MRRIGFLLCLLLAACSSATPTSPSSPVAGATARPTAKPAPTARPTAKPAPTAEPTLAPAADASPPADAPGAFVWMRHEAGGIGVVVTTLRYIPGLDGGKLMGDGWFDNQGAEPVSMKDIGIAAVDGTGRRVEGEALPFDGLKGGEIAPGGRRDFMLGLREVDPLGDDYVLEITPPGAAEPIVIAGAPPAPEWPQQGLELGPALYQAADAPPGFLMEPSPYFSADDPPSHMTRGGMPQPVDLVLASLESTDGGSLVALLSLFGSAAEGLPLYNQVALHEQAELLDGIGERAAYYAGPTHDRQREVVEGAFTSCNAVFFLQAAADRGAVLPDREEIIAYMGRVAARVDAGCGTRKSGTP